MNTTDIKALNLSGPMTAQLFWVSDQINSGNLAMCDMRSAKALIARDLIAAIEQPNYPSLKVYTLTATGKALVAAGYGTVKNTIR